MMVIRLSAVFVLEMCICLFCFFDSVCWSINQSLNQPVILITKPASQKLVISEFVFRIFFSPFFLSVCGVCVDFLLLFVCFIFWWAPLLLFPFLSLFCLLCLSLKLSLFLYAFFYNLRSIFLCPLEARTLVRNWEFWIQFVLVLDIVDRFFKFRRP